MSSKDEGGTQQEDGGCRHVVLPDLSWEVADLTKQELS